MSTAKPRTGGMTPLTRRRLRNFRNNPRAFWSLVIFGILFFVSLFAELVANDWPIAVSYEGKLHWPVLFDYAESSFGGDLPIEALVPHAVGTGSDTLSGAIALATAGGTLAGTIGAMLILPAVLAGRRRRA